MNAKANPSANSGVQISLRIRGPKEAKEFMEEGNHPRGRALV
jgi:hypothetical protein